MIGLDIAGGGPAGGRPLHVLAVGAHADDIEIGCGGTLLQGLAAGRVGRLDWVVLSAEGVRADEARASAERLVGGRAELEVTITAFEERFLPHQPEVKRHLGAVGSRIRPDLVFTPRLEDRHQDHRVVAELTWQAFRDHLILEYEIVKFEGDLTTPNVYVPLAADVVEAKVAHLMAAFPSQRAHHWFDESAFQAIMRLRGVESNAPSGWAEGFTGRKVALRFGPDQ